MRLNRKKEVCMTTNEIISKILSDYEGSALVRPDKTTFIAIPTEEGTYIKVAVSKLASKDVERKDGKVIPAFNFETAIENYKTFIAEQEAKAEARANAPKKERVSKADPEKVKMRAERQAKLVAYLETISGMTFTSTDIANTCTDIYPDGNVLNVGADLATISKSDERLTMEKIEGKKHWTFNK